VGLRSQAHKELLCLKVLLCHPAADVLTIENSRSGDEMIRALADFGYSRDLGPGVYDVHR
jgi:methionine synthase II (cobalamin-independent)